MSQRRFFLKNSVAGACAFFLSSSFSAPAYKKRPEPVTTNDDQPYTVKIVYAFESKLLRELMLSKIENLDPIYAINRKYEQSGQILSYVHEQDENLVANIYVFNSEKSYLAWETEMVLAKVMKPEYCSSVVAHRGDLSHLGEEGKGLNKRMLIEVRFPDKASIQS